MPSTIQRHDSTRPEMSEKRAKQGETSGHMRYVLGVGLLLAVIAGIFLYLAFFY
jgi:hypothetical protein